MTFRKRYSSAINANSLAVDERTTYSNSDVLGAMGLADRHLTEGKRPTGPGTHENIKPAPLAAALERMLMGGDTSGATLIAMLAERGFTKSFKLGAKITRGDCSDLAGICVRWYRNPSCPSCSGHGYGVIPGSTTLSDQEEFKCQPCAGTGKIQLQAVVDPDGDKEAIRTVMAWMLAELERSSAVAASAAMRALAPRMDV